MAVFGAASRRGHRLTLGGVVESVVRCGTGIEAPRSGMLKIETSSSNRDLIVVALSGWLRGEHLPELERVLGDARAAGHRITLDLRDVGLVDREGVEFLASRLTRLVSLRACPPYLRRWLEAARGVARRNHERS